MARLMYVSLVVFSLSVLTGPRLGAQAVTPPEPRGTATYITKADIDTVMNRTADKPASDQQVRAVSIHNDEYHVGVGIVHRAKASAANAGGVEHSEITEVYQIISGTATLVTGGMIKDAAVLKGPTAAVGPTLQGGPITSGGVSQKVGPGDVIIIPPNTPHWFSDISSDQIVYLVVRMDPHKALRVMNALDKK